VATRSRRTTDQNQVTPNAVTDIQGQEVDEPTAEERVDETAGVQIPVDDPPPNVAQAAEKGPPTPRESLITPTNPSIGLDGDSIATTETGPIVTEVLTQEQREHKYVALEYLSRVLDVSLESDLPFERYAKIYDKMPALDIQRFTNEFHNGKGTSRHPIATSTHLLLTTGFPTHTESPLPLPPLPMAAFIRPPTGIVETPHLPVATNQESPQELDNAARGRAFQRIERNDTQTGNRTLEKNNQSDESDDDSSASEVRDCYTNFGSKPPNNESDKVLHATLITLLPSFKRFHEAQTKKGALVSISSITNGRKFYGLT
jgi:hypothetical protein